MHTPRTINFEDIDAMEAVFDPLTMQLALRFRLKPEPQIITIPVTVQDVSCSPTQE